MGRRITWQRCLAFDHNITDAELREQYRHDEAIGAATNDEYIGTGWKCVDLCHLFAHAIFAMSRSTSGRSASPCLRIISAAPGKNQSTTAV